MSNSQVHTHTLSFSFDILQAPKQLKIHHVNQSCRHSYTPFNTHDNTDSTADGNKSSSSVRYLHTYTLSLLPKKTQTPRQMKIHHVNQKGTRSYTPFNTHDNLDVTADGDKSC